MKEDSWILEYNCFVAGFGAFGIFFRWMQLMITRNEEGLFQTGFWSFALPALFIASLILFSRKIKGMKDERQYLPKAFCAGLKNEGKIYEACRIAAGAMMVIGALLLLMQCETDKNAKFLYVLAGTGIASGIAFPILLASANKPHNENPSLYAFLAAIPVIQFATWLITCYKQNSISSIAWQYVTEVVTVSVTLVAFFQVAGFSFYTSKWHQSLFWASAGAELCIMSLADERYLGQQIMLAAAAVMLILYNWIIMSNLKTAKKANVQEEDIGFEYYR